MRKIKNILILGAGDSTRFWPLHDKIFFSFFGKPLIQHVVEQIAPFAEKMFLVVDKAKKDMVSKLVGKNVEILIQTENLQSAGGAVRSAKAIKGEVLIITASELFDFNILKKLIEKIDKKKANIIFLAKEFKEYFPGGYVQFKNNKVEAIIEKPSIDKLPSNIVKLVVDYFSDFGKFVECLEEVGAYDPEDWYERGLSLYIKKAKTVDYILVGEVWPTKYPWHVFKIMNYFLKQIKKNSFGKNATVSKKAIIVPPVYLGKNVRVGDFTKIVGPCFIDDGTVIGDYAMIRESHIGKNCLVGGYSEVTRSYLGDGVYLHRNYVGDSVLDRGSFMGAGAYTANFRFDAKSVKSKIGDQKIDSQLPKLGTILGEGAKIGVNAVTLPGVKIGRGTFVAPGMVVSEDIKDNMFVLKDEIKKNKEV